MVYAHMFFRTVNSWWGVFLLVIRLDSIAIDAELQEKSEADLKQLAEVLQKHVEESMAEYAQKLQEDPSFDGESVYQYAADRETEWDIHVQLCVSLWFVKLFANGVLQEIPCWPTVSVRYGPMKSPLFSVWV